MDPLLPGPPGEDVNRGTACIVLTAVFGFLSFATTFMRIGVRMANRQLGWDDFSIGLALCFYFIQLVFNGLAYHSGYGRHTYYLGKYRTQTTLKWSYFTEFCLFLVICFTKISICLFVLRIKKTGWLKRFLYSLISGLVITTLVCEIILFLQCRPIHAFWNRQSGTCWKPAIYNDAIWAQVAYSIFSDLACTFLPVVVLWKVQISTHLKVAVCSLMSLGLLATICAAVRASLSTRDESLDLTWSLVIITDWAWLEESLAIIGANLALSRAVYSFILHGGRSEAGRNFHKPDSAYTRRQLALRRRRGRDLSLLSRSRDSDMPLEDAVEMTTDLSITRGPRTTSAERTAGLGVGHYPYAVEDSV